MPAKCKTIYIFIASILVWATMIFEIVYLGSYIKENFSVVVGWLFMVAVLVLVPMVMLYLIYIAHQYFLGVHARFLISENSDGGINA